MLPGVLLPPAHPGRALDRQLVAAVARECVATPHGVACRPHGGGVWTAYRAAADGLHFVGRATSAAHALALVAAASAAHGATASWALAGEGADACADDGGAGAARAA